jgi:DNA-binding MarR family transcriptional regulator
MTINKRDNTEECARELLEVVPLVMRDIRTQVRSRRTPDLTIPQFRTLSYVNRNAGVSLTQVAEHIGITLPSMSKLIDVLLKKGLLTREEQPADRRRVKLLATPSGVKITEASRQGTMSYLTQKMGNMNADERATIIKAMKEMRSVFTVANKKSDVT